ncbi:MAG: hypothetical protein ACOVQ5_02820 [Flavobacteriales bacterium]|jgi:hypothetical protein
MMTFRQILAHSLFLGFCASILIIVTKTSSSFVFSFFATSACYIFLRISLLKKADKTKAILFTTLLSACALGAATQLSRDQKIIGAVAVVVLIPYAIPRRLSLRNSILLKPLTIGLCWALMTISLAFDNNLFSLPNDHSVFEIFIQIFLLTFFLSLLYDYRDKVFLSTKERTIPQFFSENNFYILLWISLVVSFVGFILLGANTNASIAYFAACIYILFFFKKIRTLNYTRTTWLTDAGFIVYAMTYLILNSTFS